MVDTTSTATLAMVCWCVRTGSLGQRAQPSVRGRRDTAPTSRAPPPTSQGPVPTSPGPRPTCPSPAPVCLDLAAGSPLPTPTWQPSLPWQRGKGLVVPDGVRTGSPGTTDSIGNILEWLWADCCPCHWNLQQYRPCLCSLFMKHYLFVVNRSWAISKPQKPKSAAHRWLNGSTSQMFICANFVCLHDQAPNRVGGLLFNQNKCFILWIV